MLTKTGMMLGVGETKDEVMTTLHDLRANNVDIVTLGQYLQPSAKLLKVERYVTPEEFKEFKMRPTSSAFAMSNPARWCAVPITPGAMSIEALQNSPNRVII